MERLCFVSLFNMSSNSCTSSAVRGLRTNSFCRKTSASMLSYKTTPRVPLEYYVGMHIVRDREKRLLSIDVRRHIYEFIRSMGLDPDNSASVSCHGGLEFVDLRSGVNVRI